MYSQEERRTRCPNSRGEWGVQMTGQARRKPRKSSGPTADQLMALGLLKASRGSREAGRVSFLTQKRLKGTWLSFPNLLPSRQLHLQNTPQCCQLSAPGALLLTVLFSALPPGPSLPPPGPTLNPSHWAFLMIKMDSPAWDVEALQALPPGCSDASPLVPSLWHLSH